MASVPKRIPKPCAHPRCGAIVRGVRYCAKHAKEATERAMQRLERQARADPDAARARDFRHGREWREARQRFIRRNPLCRNPYGIPGHVVPAEQVHHVKSVRDAWELRLCEANMMPVCRRCHGRLEYDERQNRQTGQ